MVLTFYNLRVKTCARCGSSKALTEFHRRRGNRDGLQTHCKACTREYQRERMRRNAERSAVLLPQDGGKRCSRCKTQKFWSAFARNRSADGGHQPQCRNCQALTQKEYLERNAEAVALRYAERLARRPDTAGTKQCRKCNETKSLLDFYAHRSTRDGRANYCMTCQRATTRAWQQANAEKVRQNNARRSLEVRKRDHRQWWLGLYKLTPETYADLLADQGGVCAICHQLERCIDTRTGEARRLSVDHDHKTGLVRGLLCGRCNRGLGQFEDDPEVLVRAADYLRLAVIA